jgi:hypothetical protein
VIEKEFTALGPYDLLDSFPVSTYLASIASPRRFSTAPCTDCKARQTCRTQALLCEAFDLYVLGKSGWRKAKRIPSVKVTYVAAQREIIQVKCEAKDDENTLARRAKKREQTARLKERRRLEANRSPSGDGGQLTRRPSHAFESRV